MTRSNDESTYFVQCLVGRRSPAPLYAAELWRQVVPHLDNFVRLSSNKKPLVRTYQSASYPKPYPACRGEERKAYTARNRLHDSYGWLKLGRLSWCERDVDRLFREYSTLSNWQVTDTLVFCGSESKYLKDNVLPDVAFSYSNYWRDPNHFPTPSREPFAFDQSFTLVLRADLLETSDQAKIRQSLCTIARLLNTVDGVEFFRAWRLPDFPHRLMRSLGGTTNCDVLSGRVVFDLWRQPIQLDPAFEALPHTRLSPNHDLCADKV